MTEEEVRKPMLCQMPSAAKKLAMSQQRFDPNLSIEAVAGSGAAVKTSGSVSDDASVDDGLSPGAAAGQKEMGG